MPGTRGNKLALESFVQVAGIMDKLLLEDYVHVAGIVDKCQAL